jgi:hypothetical protein
MKIIITENQNKLLINEEISSNIGNMLKNLTKFTTKVFSETKEQTGLDFGFMLSWGTTLGGLMIPVSQFIQDKHPEFTTANISLVITGAIATYYSSNKKILRDLLDVIKEKGLIDLFNEVLSITGNLKETFLKFVESLNIAMGRMSNMMAYTFLIPILPTLYNMSQEGLDTSDINQIVKRLISYGVITTSSVLLKQLITKIIKRFRS